MEPYLDLVRGQNYRDRPHDRIRANFHSLGYPAIPTSQDAAKAVACLATGTARINCFPCLARYVGELGLHMTATKFREDGYADTILYEGAIPEFRFPNRSQLNDWIWVAWRPLYAASS